MLTAFEARIAIDEILKAQALPRDRHDELRLGLEMLHTGAVLYIQGGPVAEKMHQQDRQQLVADIAVQLINADMANTPAAGTAYDEAARLATIPISAQLDFTTTAAGQALQKCLGEMELKYKQVDLETPPVAGPTITRA
jgi:hypothetical protein